MEERFLISSEIVETIGEYTIVKTKERMIDVNGKPYGNVKIWYDAVIDMGNGDIVASFRTLKEIKKWIKDI